MKEFRHGKITLLNCDCMEYMAGCGESAFDLAIVDPPYGIGFSNEKTRKDGRFSGAKESKWDDSIPDDEYFENLKIVSANQIVWGGNYFKNMWPCRGFIFWNKHQPVENFSDGELACTSFNTVATCFDFPYYGNIVGNSLAKEKRVHITQKPIALYKWLLSKYAKPDQRIFDSHLGSGSSAIAAHYFGCEFVGCEIDTYYFNAAVERFKRETRQVDMFQPR